MGHDASLMTPSLATHGAWPMAHGPWPMAHQSITPSLIARSLSRIGAASQQERGRPQPATTLGPLTVVHMHMHIHIHIHIHMHIRTWSLRPISVVPAPPLTAHLSPPSSLRLAHPSPSPLTLSLHSHPSPSPLTLTHYPTPQTCSPLTPNRSSLNLTAHRTPLTPHPSPVASHPSPSPITPRPSPLTLPYHPSPITSHPSLPP